MVVDVGIGTIESKYIKGVTTANGDTARYGLNVYVDEKLVDMDSYADYNGIRIQPLQTEKDNLESRLQIAKQEYDAKCEAKFTNCT